MTCIVGIAEKGNVYLGGDSAGVAGLSITIRSDDKVFRNGSFIMGFTTSFRMGQLLRYNFKAPKQLDKQSDMEYMVTDFINAVRQCFADGGWGKASSKENNEGGTFLVGYSGTLYQIDSDFQVGVPSLQYAAVGCGEDLAMGALYATTKMTPELRLKKALEAASTFSAGVAPPFTYVKLLKLKK